jgi:hypothetical protein
MSYKFIVPYSASLTQFKRLLSQGIWLGVGGQLLNWTDDNSPPLPSKTLSTIPGLDYLVYIHFKTLVKAQVGGSIVTDQGDYAPVSSSLSIPTLVNSSAFYLYLEGLVDPNIDSKLSDYEYKVLGLVENVQFSIPVTPSASLIINSEDVDSYDLFWIATTPATQISNATTTKFQFIKEG